MKPCLLLPAAVLLGVCSAFAQDPKATADILTGDAKGSAANNPVCKLFTAAEASKYVGKTVGAGENAAGGSACQWADKDYEGDMMVQIVPASYHEQPTLGKGFQRLPEIGRGKESIIVSVNGPAASQQTAVALLKETLARRK